MDNPDQNTLIRAVEDARRILGEYIAPGPRDAIRTVDRLLAVLDRDDVVHASSCSGLRQLTVGNEPITPLRHAATTSSTPETRNIGAAISGKLNLSQKDERESEVGKAFLPGLSSGLVAANIGTANSQ